MYFLLLSLQKGIYLHITHHVGISKMRPNSVFHKTLFLTALKTRFNLLNHFLDSQISFKLNSLFFRKKKKCFYQKLLWFKHLPSRKK